MPTHEKVNKREIYEVKVGKVSQLLKLLRIECAPPFITVPSKLTLNSLLGLLKSITHNIYNMPLLLFKKAFYVLIKIQ